MNHIPGLDKWLTTPSEDMFDGFESWAQKVADRLVCAWEDEMESTLQMYYERGLSPIEAAKKLENWEAEND